MALITGQQLVTLVNANGFVGAAEYLQAVGSWLKEGSQIVGQFARASKALDRALTDADKTAIRAKTAAWLAREPVAADYVESD
jgi:hypothetical protein